MHTVGTCAVEYTLYLVRYNVVRSNLVILCTDLIYNLHTNNDPATAAAATLMTSEMGQTASVRQ